jgi:hypothetical protein
MLISTAKSYALILTKNGLGFILESVFKNSSGHPGADHSFLRGIKYCLLDRVARFL